MPAPVAFNPQGYDHAKHRRTLAAVYGIDPYADPAEFTRRSAEGWAAGWTGWIRALEPGELPAVVVECVGATQWAVSDVLGLPDAPAVNFFTPCAADYPDAVPIAEPVQGFAPIHPAGEDIFVRAGMPLGYLEETIAHEIRHVWQGLNGYRRATHGQADLERDAYWFAQEWMERLEQCDDDGTRQGQDAWGRSAPSVGYPSP